MCALLPPESLKRVQAETMPHTSKLAAGPCLREEWWSCAQNELPLLLQKFLCGGPSTWFSKALAVSNGSTIAVKDGREWCHDAETKARPGAETLPGGAMQLGFQLGRTGLAP